jgi:hypothetical protein
MAYMFRLIARTFTIVFVLASGLIFARIIGGFDKPGYGLVNLNTHYCTSQPCWHGIRPGQTGLSTARSIIQNDMSLHIIEDTDFHFCWTKPPDPYQAGCIYASSRNGAVTEIDLYSNDKKLRLGDMLFLFGEPIGATLCIGDSAAPPIPLVKELIFQGSIRVRAFENSQLRAIRRLDITLPVIQIYYGSNDVEIPHYRPWKGFTWLDKVNDC